MIFSSFQFNDFLNSLVVIAILVLEVKREQESRQEDWLKYLLLTTHFRESVEVSLVHKTIHFLKLATSQDPQLMPHAHQKDIHDQQFEPRPLFQSPQGVRLPP